MEQFYSQHDEHLVKERGDGILIYYHIKTGEASRLEFPLWATFLQSENQECRGISVQ